MFSKANVSPVEHLLVQRQMCWLGLEIRLPDNCLPRRLYGELSQGQRLVGRLKQFLDHIRMTLQKCNIHLSDMETSATDRDVCRTTSWMAGSAPPWSVVLLVMWPRLSQRLVFIVPAAADPVPRPSHYGAIFIYLYSPGQLLVQRRRQSRHTSAAAA